MLLSLAIRLFVLVTDPLARARRDERGQSTVEYALVCIGVIALAVMVIVWARDNQAVGNLFDAVFQRATDQANDG